MYFYNTIHYHAAIISAPWTVFNDLVVNDSFLQEHLKAIKTVILLIPRFEEGWNMFIFFSWDRFSGVITGVLKHSMPFCHTYDLWARCFDRVVSKKLSLDTCSTHCYRCCCTPLSDKLLLHFFFFLNKKTFLWIVYFPAILKTVTIFFTPYYQKVLMIFFSVQCMTDLSAVINHLQMLIL